MPSGDVRLMRTWLALLMGPGIISRDLLLPVVTGALLDPLLLVAGACMYCIEVVDDCAVEEAV